MRCGYLVVALGLSRGNLQCVEVQSTLLVVHHSKVLMIMLHDEMSSVCKMVAIVKSPVQRLSSNVAKSDNRGYSVFASTLAPRVGAVILSTKTRGHPRATPMNIFRGVTFPPTSTGLISIAGSRSDLINQSTFRYPRYLSYSSTWIGLVTTLKNLL